MTDSDKPTPGTIGWADLTVEDPPIEEVIEQVFEQDMAP